MPAHVNLVIALVIVCGCTNSNHRPQQPDARNNAKDNKVKSVDRPFMEHPSGDFDTAIDAMADAIKRLRELPEWKNWITFSAQGMGGRVDSYHFAEIQIKQDEFKLQKPVEVDIELVTKRAGVPESCLSKNGDVYSIAKATPVQAARIMDVIFRQYLGIRPHTGEGDDYAIGAEW
jgi:hypothetical protein